MTYHTTAELEAIAARHPELFDISFWKRHRAAIIALGIAAYLVFCAWFFSIAQVLGGANWSIAGSYLADWVSYETRPDIRIRTDGTMRIVFPNNDPLGPDPRPDWLKADRTTITVTLAEPLAASAATEAKPASKFNFMAPATDNAASLARNDIAQATTTEEVATRILVEMSASGTIEIVDGMAILTRGGERVEIPLRGAGDISVSAPLPEWASQKRPGEKIVASFGLAGWAEVEADRVKVRKRFLGWENFLFDTNSAFFGKSMGDVVGLILSDVELKPGTSNWSLAVNDVLYNPSWQHLDVWTKLLQTVVMAFVGTLFAMVVAFPLAFLAARNITRNVLLNQVLKRFFDFQRSVDMLIWALFFTRAFGPGPLAGMSAIFFTDTGTLGKLYAEALENIDDKQPEGIRSVGAAPVAVNRFGVLPQVMPVFISQALYFWESNTRSATIIGAVGAGGIGLKLWEAMRTNSDWENVAYMVLLILLVVFLFDGLSNALRSRLMGRAS
jgi:phosphonate transport system permease protein